MAPRQRRFALISAAFFFWMLIGGSLGADVVRIIAIQPRPKQQWSIYADAWAVFFSRQDGIFRDPTCRSGLTGGYYVEGNGSGWSIETVALPYWVLLSLTTAIIVLVRSSPLRRKLSGMF
jgi:hypothetical protein